MKLIRTPLLLAILLNVPFAAAQQRAEIKRLDGSLISASEIDGTVKRLMSAAEVPGVAIAIFSHGEIAYLKAYGWRDVDKKLPLTPDSVLSAASFTKVAFAYMVMQLVDEGKLDLDRPVYQYLPKPLPDYINYKDLAEDPRYKRITARMLLSHTSGFANFRWLEDGRKLRIHFEPGSRYAYSGEGLLLLQFVVETITKKPLQDLMEERVFAPLKMERSSMVWQDRFESDYANGYDEYGRSLGPQRRPAADAAGSMQTTARDFALFFRAIMLGQGLNKASRDQMLSPQSRFFPNTNFLPWQRRPRLKTRKSGSAMALDGGSIGRLTEKLSSKKVMIQDGEIIAWPSKSRSWV